MASRWWRVPVVAVGKEGIAAPGRDVISSQFGRKGRRYGERMILAHGARGSVGIRAVKMSRESIYGRSREDKWGVLRGLTRTVKGGGLIGGDIVRGEFRQG